MVDVSKIISFLTKDILTLARNVLESNNMVNPKVGINTLRDSDLYKNLQVQGNNDFIFSMMFGDYVQYIESGRRKGAPFPPVEPIVRWARKRGIPTDNSTIYLIRRAISRDGIKPRPILDYIFSEMDDMWDNQWGDKIFDIITEELSEIFNQ